MAVQPSIQTKSVRFIQNCIFFPFFIRFLLLSLSQPEFRFPCRGKIFVSSFTAGGPIELEEFFFFVMFSREPRFPKKQIES